jgi:antirestriction protein ArdC
VVWCGGWSERAFARAGYPPQNRDVSWALLSRVSMVLRWPLVQIVLDSLRYNGQPYSGINILSLWMSAELQGFSIPIWMTFRQAREFDAHVRKGEKGSFVVCANTITRTDHDDNTGADIEREVPYMKATPCSMSSRSTDYRNLLTQSLPRRLIPSPASITRKSFSKPATGGNRAYYAQEPDYVQMRPLSASAMPRTIIRRWLTR